MIYAFCWNEPDRYAPHLLDRKCKIVDGPIATQPLDLNRSRWQQRDEVLLRLGDGMTDEDLAAVRCEIESYCLHHLKAAFKAAGLVELVKTEKFNRCSRFCNVIDFQFDHPGVLPIGTRLTYRVPMLDLQYHEEVG